MPLELCKWVTRLETSHWRACPLHGCFSNQHGFCPSSSCRAIPRASWVVAILLLRRLPQEGFRTDHGKRRIFKKTHAGFCPNRAYFRPPGARRALGSKIVHDSGPTPRVLWENKGFSQIPKNRSFRISRATTHAKIIRAYWYDTCGLWKRPYSGQGRRKLGAPFECELCARACEAEPVTCVCLQS